MSGGQSVSSPRESARDPTLIAIGRHAAFSVANRSPGRAMTTSAAMMTRMGAGAKTMTWTPSTIAASSQSASHARPSPGEQRQLDQEGERTDGHDGPGGEQPLQHGVQRLPAGALRSRPSWSGREPNPYGP